MAPCPLPVFTKAMSAPRLRIKEEGLAVDHSPESRFKVWVAPSVAQSAVIPPTTTSELASDVSAIAAKACGGRLSSGPTEKVGLVWFNYTSVNRLKLPPLTGRIKTSLVICESAWLIWPPTMYIAC